MTESALTVAGVYGVPAIVWAVVARDKCGGTCARAGRRAWRFA